MPAAQPSARLAALVALLILGLLGAALYHWWTMRQDLQRMTLQLERAAQAQQQLQRRLDRSRALLEEQAWRLQLLEARRPLAPGESTGAGTRSLSTDRGESHDH